MILSEPRRFNMREGVDFKDSVAPCKTAACIAGTAAILDIQKEFSTRGWVKADRLLPTEKFWTDGRVGIWRLIQKRAIKALSLTPGQAERLFIVHNWPTKFENSFGNTKSRRGEARVAVNRINHFISTKGAE